MNYEHSEIHTPGKTYNAYWMNELHSRGHKTKHRRGAFDICLIYGQNIFDYSWDYWDALLGLARRFGWVPMGTLLIEDFKSVWQPPLNAKIEQQNRQRVEELLKTRKCDYQTDGTVVTADDARNMANALDRALEEASGDDFILGHDLKQGENTEGQIISQKEMVQALRSLLNQEFFEIWYH
jgi:hypothetical protein